MTVAAVSESLVEELRWLSATETAARVRSGALTPRQVVEAALQRIEAAQPKLNAFTYVLRDEALAEADAVSVRLAAGEDLPLAGVPVAAKDDVPLRGVAVTKGSFAYNHVTPEDAEFIRLVRAAGGVIVGSTRTPEFCLVPFTESERGGITRNPWNTDRTPGGSSGGSAAAVAAGLVPIGLGGDGGGSLRGPAAWTGIVGLFATPGSISNLPMGQVWTGLGIQGGLARTIADVAALYDVLLEDPQDLTGAIKTAPSGLRIGQTLDRALDRPIPQGGKIDPAWIRASDLTATALGQFGHDVSPVTVRFGNTPNKFMVRYLASLADELDNDTDEPARAERGTRLLAKLGRPLARFLPWATDSTKERQRIERALEGYDLLLTPAMPCSAPPVGERDGKPAIITALKAAKRVSFLSQWNHLGWPGISIPAGLDADGLPVAALLTARPGNERLLLQVAAQLEQARPWPLGKAV